MSAGSRNRPFIEPSRMAFLEPVSRLYTTNPFEPAWEALVKAALGDAYVPEDRAPGRNGERLRERLAAALDDAARGLAQGARAGPEEIGVYTGAAIYALWDGFGPRLQGLVDEDGTHAPFYDELVERHRFLFGRTGVPAPEPAHLFAVLYQARRAWHFAASKILGGSPSAGAARAALWRANLGSDLSTYAGGLYLRMDAIPVLITGETGTGKELAAQCVGWSRYIPFDARARQFAGRYADDFHARNLCDVPRELIESALFGHKKGSFTGAAADATGCFGLPRENGTLFFDEIGELPLWAQVMLLRALESREYVPIGETRPRRALGRPVFATLRDLEAMCEAGTFRADLFERMNVVRIHMPPLRQMVAEAPGEMRAYVGAFAAEAVGRGQEAARWADRVAAAIEETRQGYGWPRNLRELKHYVERYILSDGRAASLPSPSRGAGPAAPSAGVPDGALLGDAAKEGKVSVNELTRAYVRWVYALTGQNKSETARRTGLNYRTVGQMIDSVRVAERLAGAKGETEPR